VLLRLSPLLVLRAPGHKVILPEGYQLMQSLCPYAYSVLRPFRVGGYSTCAKVLYGIPRPCILLATFPGAIHQRNWVPHQILVPDPIGAEVALLGS
jgi:hypothetical protein